MGETFLFQVDPYFGKPRTYSVHTTNLSTIGNTAGDCQTLEYRYDTGTLPSFERIEQAMNDVFEEFLGKKTKTNSISDAIGKVSFPKIDLYSDGEKAIILASVPGYRKEDLEIELIKNVLSISSKENALESELNGMTKVHGEIKKTKFTRELVFNEDILNLKDAKNLDITLENGILKIVIPYIEEKIIKKNTLKIK